MPWKHFNFFFNFQNSLLGIGYFERVYFHFKNKIQINLTAIFTHNQIKRVLPILKDTQTILSVFAGRIYDSGVDASKTMQEICDYVNDKSDCEVLWASPRMPYDYISAINVGAKIITMQPDQIKKIKLFGKNYELRSELPEHFKNTLKKKRNHIFLYHVKNPYLFGNIEIKNNKIISLKEKSKKPKNNFAVTGLYLFNQNSLKHYKKLKTMNYSLLMVRRMLYERSVLH